jgi:hypothetical protein
MLPVDVPETLTAIIPLLTTLPMRVPPAALDFAAVALPPPAKAVMAWALAAVAVLVELATIVPLLTTSPRNTPPVLRAADDWATPPLAEIEMPLAKGRIWATALALTLTRPALVMLVVTSAPPPAASLTPPLALAAIPVASTIFLSSQARTRRSRCRNPTRLR